MLRTYDVGEADRFCILFTKERGRLAARASGVRKPKSRFGGALLPFRHIETEMKEEASGNYLSTAVLIDAPLGNAPTVHAFGRAQEGIELLLALVQHEERLPDVFDSTLAYIRRLSTHADHPVLSYTIRLLALLGVLPDEEHLLSRFDLTPEERRFLHSSVDGRFLAENITLTHLPVLCEQLLEDHLSAPLRSPGISALLRGTAHP